MGILRGNEFISTLKNGIYQVQMVLTRKKTPKMSKNAKNTKKRQKTPKNNKKPTKTQKLGQVSIVQSLGTKMGAFCKNQIFSNLSRFPITRKPQFWHSKVSNGKLFNFFHMKDIQNPSRVTYLHVVRPCYTRGFHSKSNFQKVK